MTRLSTFTPLLALLLLAGCNETSTVADASTAPGLQAGILISPAEGNSEKHFISLEADSLTALEALESTGVDLVTNTDYGVALCAISGVGHPADNCFGEVTDPYWGFFIRNTDGTWKYADVGVADYDVADGDVLAFVYTTSDAEFNPVRTPPAADLEDFSE